MGMLAMGMLAVACKAKPPADAMVSGANSGPALTSARTPPTKRARCSKAGRTRHFLAATWSRPGRSRRRRVRVTRWHFCPADRGAPALKAGSRAPHRCRQPCSAVLARRWPLHPKTGCKLAAERVGGGDRRQAGCGRWGSGSRSGPCCRPPSASWPERRRRNPATAVDTSGLETQRQAVQALNIQGAGPIAEVQRQMGTGLAGEPARQLRGGGKRASRRDLDSGAHRRSEQPRRWCNPARARGTADFEPGAATARPRRCSPVRRNWRRKSQPDRIRWSSRRSPICRRLTC